MRQFDKDKIMGNVVECTTEEQCKELIDFYIREINPDEESWESFVEESVSLETNYGILVRELEGWSYSEIDFYKANYHKIIPFNEALLQTETKENQVQESKQETHLFLNDEIALSKEDFIRFALEGYVFDNKDGGFYYFDSSYSNPFRRAGVGFSESTWSKFNPQNKFKVVKSPYESEWRQYKCIKNGVAYFVETDNLSGIEEYIQYDSIQEIIKEEN